jgi:hypothetical protein
LRTSSILRKCWRRNGPTWKLGKTLPQQKEYWRSTTLHLRLLEGLPRKKPSRDKYAGRVCQMLPEIDKLHISGFGGGGKVCPDKRPMFTKLIFEGKIDLISGG